MLCFSVPVTLNTNLSIQLNVINMFGGVFLGGGGGVGYCLGCLEVFCRNACGALEGFRGVNTD